MTVRRHCVVDGAAIDYLHDGSGTPTVFVHGVYVTGEIWTDVIARLGGRVRAIAPTWPLGAHAALPDWVDLTAPAAIRRLTGLLEVLDLTDVTVVANDTGGGLVLAALGDPALDNSRIARLVLTNCDSCQHFPPAQFAPLVWLCRRLPAVGRVVLRVLASTAGQRFFLRQVARRPLSDTRRSAVFGSFATSAASRDQAVVVTASLDPSLTLRATEAMRRFTGPVAVVWGLDDPCSRPPTGSALPQISLVRRCTGCRARRPT